MGVTVSKIILKAQDANENITTAKLGDRPITTSAWEAGGRGLHVQGLPKQQKGFKTDYVQTKKQ